MTKILVLHGPNLNLLGERDPEQYGSLTLEEINQRLVEYGETRGVEVEAAQSNLEGELVNYLQGAVGEVAGVVFNPGGYAHTSVVIRDAVDAIEVPVIEVHLSNILARESYRRRSLTAPVCLGSISGFGLTSYLLGVDAILHGRGDE